PPFLTLPLRPPPSPLFPYTTLFRSCPSSSPRSSSWWPSWARWRSPRSRHDAAARLVPGPQRRAVRDRRARRAHPAQRDRHLHGDRAHAERRQPELRGARPEHWLDGRAGDRLLRDDGGGRGGRRRARDHPLHVPEPRDDERRRAGDASMVIETTWLRWIVALPALGVLFNVFVGRRATGAVKLVGPGVVGAAFVLAVSAALRRPEGGALHDHIYTWIVAGPFRAEAGLSFDALAMVMTL